MIIISLSLLPSCCPPPRGDRVSITAVMAGGSADIDGPATTTTSAASSANASSIAVPSYHYALRFRAPYTQTIDETFTTVNVWSWEREYGIEGPLSRLWDEVIPEKAGDTTSPPSWWSRFVPNTPDCVEYVEKSLAADTDDGFAPSEVLIRLSQVYGGTPYFSSRPGKAPSNEQKMEASRRRKPTTHHADAVDAAAPLYPRVTYSVSANGFLSMSSSSPCNMFCDAFDPRLMPVSERTNPNASVYPQVALYTTDLFPRAHQSGWDHIYGRQGSVSSSVFHKWGAPEAASRARVAALLAKQVPQTANESRARGGDEGGDFQPSNSTPRLPSSVVGGTPLVGARIHAQRSVSDFVRDEQRRRRQAVRQLEDEAVAAFTMDYMRSQLAADRDAYARSSRTASVTSTASSSQTAVSGSPTPTTPTTTTSTPAPITTALMPDYLKFPTPPPRNFSIGPYAINVAGRRRKHFRRCQHRLWWPSDNPAVDGTEGVVGEGRGGATPSASDSVGPPSDTTVPPKGHWDDDDDDEALVSALVTFNNVPLFSVLQRPATSFSTYVLNLTAQVEIFFNGTIVFRYLSVPEEAPNAVLPNPASSDLTGLTGLTGLFFSTNSESFPSAPMIQRGLLMASSQLATSTSTGTTDTKAGQPTTTSTRAGSAPTTTQGSPLESPVMLTITHVIDPEAPIEDPTISGRNQSGMTVSAAANETTSFLSSSTSTTSSSSSEPSATATSVMPDVATGTSTKIPTPQLTTPLTATSATTVVLNLPRLLARYRYSATAVRFDLSAASLASVAREAMPSSASASSSYPPTTDVSTPPPVSSNDTAPLLLTSDCCPWESHRANSETVDPCSVIDLEGTMESPAPESSLLEGVTTRSHSSSSTLAADMVPGLPCVTCLEQGARLGLDCVFCTDDRGPSSAMTGSSRGVARCLSRRTATWCGYEGGPRPASAMYSEAAAYQYSVDELFDDRAAGSIMLSNDTSPSAPASARQTVSASSPAEMTLNWQMMRNVDVITLPETCGMSRLERYSRRRSTLAGSDATTPVSQPSLGYAVRLLPPPSAVSHAASSRGASHLPSPLPSFVRHDFLSAASVDFTSGNSQLSATNWTTTSATSTFVSRRGSGAAYAPLINESGTTAPPPPSSSLNSPPIGGNAVASALAATLTSFTSLSVRNRRAYRSPPLTSSQNTNGLCEDTAAVVSTSPSSFTANPPVAPRTDRGVIPWRRWGLVFGRDAIVLPFNVTLYPGQSLVSTRAAGGSTTTTGASGNNEPQQDSVGTGASSSSTLVSGITGNVLVLRPDGGLSLHFVDPEGSAALVALSAAAMPAAATTTTTRSTKSPATSIRNAPLTTPKPPPATTGAATATTTPATTTTTLVIPASFSDFAVVALTQLDKEVMINRDGGAASYRAWQAAVTAGTATTATTNASDTTTTAAATTIRQYFRSMGPLAVISTKSKQELQFSTATVAAMELLRGISSPYCVSSTTVATTTTSAATASSTTTTSANTAEDVSNCEERRLLNSSASISGSSCNVTDVLEIDSVAWDDGISASSSSISDGVDVDSDLDVEDTAAALRRIEQAGEDWPRQIPCAGLRRFLTRQPKSVTLDDIAIGSRQSIGQSQLVRQPSDVLVNTTNTSMKGDTNSTPSPTGLGPQDNQAMVDDDEADRFNAQTATTTVLLSSTTTTSVEVCPQGIVLEFSNVINALDRQQELPPFDDPFITGYLKNGANSDNKSTTTKSPGGGTAEVTAPTLSTSYQVLLFDTGHMRLHFGPIADVYAAENMSTFLDGIATTVAIVKGAPAVMGHGEAVPAAEPFSRGGAALEARASLARVADVWQALLERGIDPIPTPPSPRYPITLDPGDAPEWAIGVGGGGGSSSSRRARPLCSSNLSSSLLEGVLSCRHTVASEDDDALPSFIASSTTGADWWLVWELAARDMGVEWSQDGKNTSANQGTTVTVKRDPVASRGQARSFRVWRTWLPETLWTTPTPSDAAVTAPAPVRGGFDAPPWNQSSWRLSALQAFAGSSPIGPGDTTWQSSGRLAAPDTLLTPPPPFIANRTTSALTEDDVVALIAGHGARQGNASARRAHVTSVLDGWSVRLLGSANVTVSASVIELLSRGFQAAVLRGWGVAPAIFQLGDETTTAAASVSKSSRETATPSTKVTRAPSRHGMVGVGYPGLGMATSVDVSIAPEPGVYWSPSSSRSLIAFPTLVVPNSRWQLPSGTSLALDPVPTCPACGNGGRCTVTYRKVSIPFHAQKGTQWRTLYRYDIPEVEEDTASTLSGGGDNASRSSCPRGSSYRVVLRINRAAARCECPTPGIASPSSAHTSAAGPSPSSPGAASIAWLGAECQRCPPNYYELINGTALCAACPHCDNDGYCNPFTGRCDCALQFYGSRCEAVCPSWSATAATVAFAASGNRSVAPPVFVTAKQPPLAMLRVSGFVPSAASPSTTSTTTTASPSTAGAAALPIVNVSGIVPAFACSNVNRCPAAVGQCYCGECACLAGVLPGSVLVVNASQIQISSSSSSSNASVPSPPASATATASTTTTSPLPFPSTVDVATLTAIRIVADCRQGFGENDNQNDGDAADEHERYLRFTQSVAFAIAMYVLGVAFLIVCWVRFRKSLRELTQPPNSLRSAGSSHGAIIARTTEDDAWGAEERRDAGAVTARGHAALQDWDRQQRALLDDWRTSTTRQQVLADLNAARHAVPVSTSAAEDVEMQLRVTPSSSIHPRDAAGLQVTTVVPQPWNPTELHHPTNPLLSLLSNNINGSGAASLPPSLPPAPPQAVPPSVLLSRTVMNPLRLPAPTATMMCSALLRAAEADGRSLTAGPASRDLTAAEVAAL